MSWYFARGGIRTGPVPREELDRQARTGGLVPTDLVWTEGMAEWQPAGSVPGLFPAGPVPQGNVPPLGNTAPAPPSSLPPPRPAAPQPPPRPMGDDPVMRAILPVGRSGWAIAAGYLGLLSLLGIFGPFALATGILAVFDIRRNPHKHGMGRAIFGIVMGALGSAALALALFALISQR